MPMSDPESWVEGVSRRRADEQLNETGRLTASVTVHVAITAVLARWKKGRVCQIVATMGRGRGRRARLQGCSPRERWLVIDRIVST